MENGSVYKWSFIERVSIALINLGVNIALARMLTTADFGLLAMIAIFIAVASDLSSCGLSDGLVHKTRPTEMDYSTVFVFNAAFGIIFGLAFFLTAPLTARFFGHEELIGIMRVVGICFFFQTMSYVQETRLRKLLKMRTICFVRVGATLTVSALGIAAAAMGYGYKALVITQVVLSFFFFAYYTIASRWFPKIQFSARAFKEFFGYGVHLMLAYLATLVGRNINTFVLGRYYPSPAMSGIYYQGAKLSGVPFGVTESTLNFPFFAVASNEEDAGRVRILINNMLSAVLAINGCLLMLMLVVAAPGIELLYGDKWLGAIPIFRILALAEFLICVRAYLQTICKVHARTRFIRNMGIGEVLIQLAMLGIFYSYGITWIAWTQTMGVGIATVVYTFYCRKYTGLNIGDICKLIFKATWLYALAALICVPVLGLIVGLPSLARCIIVALVFIGVIIFVGQIFKVESYIVMRDRLLKRTK